MLGLRGTGAVLTIVDRKTRYTLLSKVETTHAEVVNNATAMACANSRTKVRTMTDDNGHEFGEFWKLEANMKAPVYFTHPLCPWERGTVENTIGLLRQYLPKRTDLRTIDDETLKACQDALNSRPRKSLGYLTPDEARTGKRRKLITQKLFDYPKLEYYEKYYLNEEEIKTWRFSLLILSRWPVEFGQISVVTVGLLRKEQKVNWRQRSVISNRASVRKRPLCPVFERGLCFVRGRRWVGWIRA